MLLAGIFDAPRPISSNGLLIILWLAVVNTALAFFLWNHALRTIPAYELSVIQNAMLPEIAILAWLFLGEQLSLIMGIGIVIVIVGVALTQIGRLRRSEPLTTVAA